MSNLSKFSIAAILCALVVVGYISARHKYTEVINISLYSRGDQYSRHAIRLIKLAAKKENFKTNIKIIKSQKNAIELRNSLRKGDIDLIWTATSKSLEKDFYPIEVPLYMGLLGYRSCLINSDNKDSLHHVKDLSDLKKLRFAQGYGWSDIEILENAGLTVDVMEHMKIFELVDSKKIDCFPRAIFEAKQEQYEYRYRYYYKLHVDKSFMIKYDLPFYFFLNSNKTKLYSILKSGLSKSIEDGSYMDEVLKTKSLRYARSELERNMNTLIINISDDM